MELFVNLPKLSYVLQKWEIAALLSITSVNIFPFSNQALPIKLVDIEKDLVSENGSSVQPILKAPFLFPTVKVLHLH